MLVAIKPYSIQKQIGHLINQPIQHFPPHQSLLTRHTHCSNKNLAPHAKKREREFVLPHKRRRSTRKISRY